MDVRGHRMLEEVESGGAVRNLPTSTPQEGGEQDAKLVPHRAVRSVGYAQYLA
jgi:hypothetical protein